MLRYSELYDYILGVLYSLKRNGQTGYFSLKDIIKHLNQPSTPNEIFEIGKYLEAEGLTKANFTLGDVFVEITPQGIVHFENKDEKFVLTFNEFTKQKDNQTTVDNAAAKLSETSVRESKKPIVEKTEAIISYLNSIKDLEHSDFRLDAEILKLEVMKDAPDKEVIALKLLSLENLSGIRQQAAELKEFFSYFLSRHF